MAKALSTGDEHSTSDQEIAADNLSMKTVQWAEKPDFVRTYASWRLRPAHFSPHPAGSVRAAARRPVTGKNHPERHEFSQSAPAPENRCSQSAASFCIMTRGACFWVTQPSRCQPSWFLPSILLAVICSLNSAQSHGKHREYSFNPFTWSAPLIFSLHVFVTCSRPEICDLFERAWRMGGEWEVFQTCQPSQICWWEYLAANALRSMKGHFSLQVSNQDHDQKVSVSNLEFVTPAHLSPARATRPSGCGVPAFKQETELIQKDPLTCKKWQGV